MDALQQSSRAKKLLYSNGIPTTVMKVVAASCAEVCSDTRSLFYSPSSNLATCATWSSYINENALPRGNNLTEAFSAVGLYLNDSASSIYANTIAQCFIDFYAAGKHTQLLTDLMIPAECTSARIFPNRTTDPYLIGILKEPDSGVRLGISSAKNCIEAICSPRTLDPDLAGIGVGWFASITKLRDRC